MKTFLKISISLFVLFSLLLLTFNAMASFQTRNEAQLPVSALLLSDSQKAEIITTYAPKVWLSGNQPGHGLEIYFPSPVEFSFQHNARYYNDGNWWLHTDRDMGSPSDILDYFHGCDGFPCGLSDVPVYAFWDQVDDVLIGDELTDVVDLIYWFWFPYNRGKWVDGITYGHHVGDWEHISIRLVPEWVEESELWIFLPDQIYLSRHTTAESELLSWNEILKEGNHPIVYAAWGSHGIYKDPGAHKYKDIYLPPFALIDYCSAGIAWDTWQYVEAYDYDTQTGLIENAWPSWMSKAYANPNLGYTDPASGPIKRWGNPESGCVFDCQLYQGPDGPVDKKVWDVQDLK